MIKIKTPIRWFEGERSGLVILIADDGAVILSDHSREVMPEWLDEIVHAVNAHEALMEACKAAGALIARLEDSWCYTTPEGQQLRAALAKAEPDD